MFNVLVLSNKKTIYSFNWSLEKGDENNCLDCWFTSSVSRPINMGELDLKKPPWIYIGILS